MEEIRGAANGAARMLTRRKTAFAASGRLKVTVAEPAGLVAVAWRLLYMVARVGVPLRTPVEGLKVSHDGKLLAESESGAEPLAVKVKL